MPPRGGADRLRCVLAPRRCHATCVVGRCFDGRLVGLWAVLHHSCEVARTETAHFNARDIRVAVQRRGSVQMSTEEASLMRPGDDFSGDWAKSSHSSHNGNCVEVAGLAGDTIRVRDSKNPRGGILSFTTVEWSAFIGGVRNGEFDRKAGSR